MPIVLPVSKTIQSPPYLHGRKISWTLKAGDDGDPVFIPSYKPVTVAVTGDLDGAQVGLIGAVADDQPGVIHVDGMTPFAIRKAGTFLSPIPTQSIAPVLKGGTGSTSVTVTIFISEG
jgi:hypothetical protein